MVFDPEDLNPLDACDLHRYISCLCAFPFIQHRPPPPSRKSSRKVSESFYNSLDHKVCVYTHQTVAGYSCISIRRETFIHWQNGSFRVLRQMYDGEEIRGLERKVYRSALTNDGNQRNEGNNQPHLRPQLSISIHVHQGFERERERGSECLQLRVPLD